MMLKERLTTTELLGTWNTGRYLLPACVVNTIRQEFPNPGGVPYSGFVCLDSQEALSLD